MDSEIAVIEVVDVEVIGGDFDTEFIVTRVAYAIGDVYEVRVMETARASVTAKALDFLPKGCLPLRVFVPAVSLLDPYVDELVYMYLPPMEG